MTLVDEWKKRKYPGMLPPEQAIWRAWIKVHGAEYDEVWYNVRVGPGIKVDASWPANEQKMAKALTKARIDVVLRHDDQYTIVEVKQRAGLGAVGQVEGYQVHWQAENPTLPRATLRILTDAMSTSLPAVAVAKEILLETVAEPIPNPA